VAVKVLYKCLTKPTKGCASFAVSLVNHKGTARCTPTTS